jgi:hypothetical protein
MTPKMVKKMEPMSVVVLKRENSLRGASFAAE